MAIFVSLLFLEAYTLYRPYMEMDENLLAIASQLVVFIICFCGLVGKLDENKFEGSDGKFVGYLLTTFTGLVLGLAASIAIYQAVGRSRKRGGASDRLQWLRRLPVQSPPRSMPTVAKEKPSSSSDVLAGADIFVDMEVQDNQEEKAVSKKTTSTGTVNPLTEGAEISSEMEIEMTDRGQQSGGVNHIDDEATGSISATDQDQQQHNEENEAQGPIGIEGRP